MALTSTNDPGLVGDRGITFAMMDGSRRVSVHVSRNALAALAGHEDTDERALFAIFEQYRDLIEKVAAGCPESAEGITLTSGDFA